MAAAVAVAMVAPHPAALVVTVVAVAVTVVAPHELAAVGVTVVAPHPIALGNAMMQERRVQRVHRRRKLPRVWRQNTS